MCVYLSLSDYLFDKINIYPRSDSVVSGSIAETTLSLLGDKDKQNTSKYKGFGK